MSFREQIQQELNKNEAICFQSILTGKTIGFIRNNKDNKLNVFYNQKYKGKIETIEAIEETLEFISLFGEVIAFCNSKKAEDLLRGGA